ncbi:hypothetical protein KCP74_05930 [Salmonella enterica subsp. enterica]|nr:hypothetical protein KCP74_05930 [Salmonella enterica subsp. enterica]
MPHSLRWASLSTRRAVVKTLRKAHADPDEILSAAHQRRGATKRRLSGGGDCRTECVATRRRWTRREQGMLNRLRGS